jgi:hypothetical protein
MPSAEPSSMAASPVAPATPPASWGAPFMTASVRVGRTRPAPTPTTASAIATGRYWDRLIAKSLLRPDALGSDASRHVPDMDAVTAVTDRIRAVLAQPEAAGLRDVALVTLLAHTQSLFGLLNDLGKLTPLGFVRGYRTQKRDDRRARQALDEYERFAGSAAGPGSAQPATAAAHSIACIARATEGFRGSGPG